MEVVATLALLAALKGLFWQRPIIVDERPVRQAFLRGAQTKPILGDNPLTPTATYFIANSGGSDANNGLTTSAAWAGPNHAVNCGDMIVVQPGTYTGRFDQTFGAVSNCPSTTGGIDGTGGVYTATLVCAVAFACVTDEVWVQKSNWSVQGFACSDFSSSTSSCFRASPNAAVASLNYIAFINNVCTGASLVCFYGGNSGLAAASFSVDEFALIGNIAFGSSGTSSVCGSGLSINVPTNIDSLAGTHIQVTGNFSYGNINGVCGPNVNFNGYFTTDSGGTGSGSSTVVVASAGSGVANARAGYPIAVQNAAGIIISGIPQPNWITSVASTTLTLASNTNAVIANGASIAIGQSVDGEGLILDTWGLNGYSKQTYINGNLAWGNGGQGLLMYCASPNCNAGLTVIIDKNTFYGNAADFKHSGSPAEFNINDASIPYTLTVTNNIFQAAYTTPANVPNTYKDVPSTATGIGNPVVAFLANPGASLSGNFFKSAPSATCPAFASCNGTNDVANFNGANYASGNTFGTDPGFANVGALPSTAPSCSGRANAYQCMVAAGVVAAMVPSGAAAGKGYQSPGACAPDANYATWLKGLNYVTPSGYADGATFTQAYGLTNRPCRG